MVVGGEYRLIDGTRVGFKIEQYNSSYPLVIDPVLKYSTYLGGNGDDAGTGIAIDSNDDAYVTGWTLSSNFPTRNPIQGSHAGNWDVFVTKFNVAGNTLVYSTYLGGDGEDRSPSIDVDSNGDAYVTGLTSSSNFPTRNPIQGSHAGNWDAFVTKFNAAGNVLAYSTYLGGNVDDAGTDIAIDSNGNAYVTGYTDSSDFPTRNPIQGSHASNWDAFVTKFNAAGNALVYSTYLGGNDLDDGCGIAVDSYGDAYVTGYTDSSDFPTRNPFQGSCAGDFDAFVTKLNAAGNTLFYSTYLGGNGDDRGFGIAVDSNSDAYVTGWTLSSDFPTRNPIQGSNAGDFDAFVTKLNVAGNTIAYSTYLGGNGDDRGFGIAVDSNDNAYATGWTGSSNFPTLNPFQESYAGNRDAFVTKFNAADNTLAYSTYLGGNGDDRGLGAAVDSNDDAYVTGSTYSSNFPTLNPFQESYAGNEDAFVTVLTEPHMITVIKTADPSSGSKGALINFTLSVTNNGTASLPHVFVSDLLPAGLVYDSSSAGGANSGQYVNWTDIGPLVSGASRALWIKAEIDGSAFGTLTNRVDVTGSPEHSDEVKDNATADVESIPMEPQSPFNYNDQFCENQKVAGTGIIDVSTSIVDKKIALEYDNTMAGDGDIELDTENAYSQNAEKLKRTASSVNGSNESGFNLFETTKLTYTGETPLIGGKYLHSKAFYGGIGAEVQEMFSVNEMEKDETSFFASTMPCEPKPDKNGKDVSPEELAKMLKAAGRDTKEVEMLMTAKNGIYVPSHLIGIEAKTSFNGTWGTDAAWHKIFYKDIKAHEMFTGTFEAEKTIKFHENPVPERLHAPCEGIDC